MVFFKFNTNSCTFRSRFQFGRSYLAPLSHGLVILTHIMSWETKYNNKQQQKYWLRSAQHASQGHLYVLKTDSNPASKPHTECHSSCVRVFPGGPPRGILDNYLEKTDFAKNFKAKTIFFRREKVG